MNAKQFLLIEEATGAVEGIYPNDMLLVAINDAQKKEGKYYVVADDKYATIVYDSQPGVSYKI